MIEWVSGFDEYKSALKNSYDMPVVLLITGNWLGSTSIMNEIISQINRCNDVDIHFGEICFHSKEEFEASSFQKLPTIYLLKNGDTFKKIEGVIPSSDFKLLIAEIC